MSQLVILAQANGEIGLIGQLVPFILIFAIFWLLIIRPQRKRQKEHQEFLGALKKGDQVVTGGGVFGTVEKVDDQVVTLRISRDTRIKVLRQQIEGSQASFLSEDGEEEGEDEEQKEAS